MNTPRFPLHAGNRGYKLQDFGFLTGHVMRILICLFLLAVLTSCAGRPEIKDFRHFPPARRSPDSIIPASGIPYAEDPGTLVHTNPKLTMPVNGAAVLPLPVHEFPLSFDNRKTE